MENSIGFECLVVFVVSGSMVILAHQVHKHLFNNFMKKFDCEIRGLRKHQTKKVRFAEHVFEFPMEKGDVE
ncbi:uncharacterized protein [Cicer arietinum]|uniref:uncharacterized protein n=1 Tax=Cicer arietinum TaxID=3827 RepID=UPI00032A87DB